MIGNFGHLCLGTGTVCRRYEVLKDSEGISGLPAAASRSLARGTVPEAVGEELVSWPSQVSRHQDGATGLEREWWVPRVRGHQGRGLRSGAKVESPRRDVQNSRQGIESCPMDTLWSKEVKLPLVLAGLTVAESCSRFSLGPGQVGERRSSGLTSLPGQLSSQKLSKESESRNPH